MVTKYLSFPRYPLMLAIAGSLSLSSFAAVAAPTVIADTPLASVSSVPPTLIFAWDYSGSMGWEMMFPEYDDGLLNWDKSNRKVVKSIIQNDSNFPQYGYLFPNGSDNDFGSDGNLEYRGYYSLPPTKEFAWARSSSYNPIYYNSNETYTPWISGTTPGSSSETVYPPANPTAALSDPRRQGSAKMNLTTTPYPLNDRLSANSYKTFRIYSGMTIPKGALYIEAGRGYNSWGSKNQWKKAAKDIDTKKDEPYIQAFDVQIDYLPATFYEPYPPGETPSKDAPAGPDGRKLKEYRIEPGNSNYPSKRTYKEELQNFANWFTYYRKRKLMAMGVMGSVLDGVTGIRAGVVFFGYNSPPTIHNLADGDRTQQKQANKKLIGEFYHTKRHTGTPTYQTMNYIGEQFKAKNSGNNNFIQYACQPNALFIITDGYANAYGSSDYNNQDNNTSNPYTHPLNSNGTRADTTHPYQGTQGGTLADLAMKFYSENPRASDFPTGKVPINQSDTSPNADWNPNLHINTYALTLGAAGTIFGTNHPAATDPFNIDFTWPKFSLTKHSQPETIDDLWHATINGRGKMFLSSNPASTRQGIQSIIQSIQGSSYTTAPMAISRAPTIEDDNIYVSGFDTASWTGELKTYKIDIETGTISASNIWNPSAQAQLDNRTSANRLIATYNGTQGIPFKSTSLSSIQKQKLEPGSLFNGPTIKENVDVNDIIEYLRGDRSKEFNPDNANTKGNPFRYRLHLFGDIIHADTIFLNAAYLSYQDKGYAAYRQSTKDRSQLILQGANDGMLHAFDPKTGKEEWAYIPNRVIEEGLLSKRALRENLGFQHYYYVDGSPTLADVDFNNSEETSSGTPDWRTLFIGSLRKGGRGYYALDLTSPEEITSEAALAQKVLWEFPNDSTDAEVARNVGYSFGRPVSIKVNQKWYIMVSSGYNNGDTTGGDGKGWLFLLNPQTGVVEHKFSTTAGSPETPSGLAHLTAYQPKGVIRSAETRYIYAGDLEGNIWRFDLTTLIQNTGSEPFLFAKLVDSNNDPQPVTTALEIAHVRDQTGYKKPLIIAGTGRYLGHNDIGVQQPQTIYGLLDRLENKADDAIAAPLRSKLLKQTLNPPDAETRTLSNKNTDFSSHRGWYVDLPIKGERVNTNPTVLNRIVAVVSNIPSSDICLTGGSSYLTFLDTWTGGFVKSSLLAYSSIRIGNTISGGPSFSILPNGKVFTPLPPDKIIRAPMTLPPIEFTPYSWQEISGN